MNRNFMDILTTEAATCTMNTGWGMHFFAFDKAYVERLRNGDLATEHHFFVYFGKLLQIKLRARAIGPDKVEDLKQDTFVRVIAAVRKEGGVRQPERFGAFVNSICNNVLLEYYRSLGKYQRMDDPHEWIPDNVLDLEGVMVSKQCSQQVRKILSQLPARDGELLRAIFLEEKDKDTVCRGFGVDRNYLRVLLHRAKDKFKAVYEKEQFGAVPPDDRIREFAKPFVPRPQKFCPRPPAVSFLMSELQQVPARFLAPDGKRVNRAHCARHVRTVAQSPATFARCASSPVAFGKAERTSQSSGEL